VSVEKAGLVLAYLPSPDRGVWMLGPVPIRAYALCIIAGIVVAVMWGEKRFVERGGEPGTVTDVAVFAVPFGLVGGRLYHVITDANTYFGPGGYPIDALKIWHGGLGIWGAIALGAVGAWIGCRRRGVPLPFFADAVAPGIVTAQAIGRLGNWFNQELYGGPTTLPWGLEIYRRVDKATGLTDPLNGVAVDRTPIAIVAPTFLYELLWNLVVAALVVWADRRFRLGHGRAFAVYVAGYTFGRFFIELMRTDPATRVFGDVRINVVVAALVSLGAVAYLVKERRPREVLPWHPRPRGTHAAVPLDPAAATEEMAVPAADGAVPAADTALPAANTAVPATNVAVPAADMAVPATGGTAEADLAAAAAPTAVPEVAPTAAPTAASTPAPIDTDTDTAANGRPSVAHREPVPADALSARRAETDAEPATEIDTQTGSPASRRAP
jgi:prolipoprotein diacylglyceryl transferase